MNKSTMNNPSATEQDGKKDAIVDQAKQAVSHAASQAKEQVSSQLSTQFDMRKDKAVETMGSVADAIRGTSEKLKGVGPLGDVAGRAADGIESVADFFEGKQIGDLVKDVNRFARREPALFIGAAFAIGLIGGRFLKSSVRKNEATYAQGGGQGYDRYAAQYGGSFGDGGYDDFLTDADLEEDIASQRGGYGASAQRTGRTTQPFGSSPPQQSASAPRTGGSYGASQGSVGSAGSTGSTGSTSGPTGSTGSSTSGSSYGASQGSSSTTSNASATAGAAKTPSVAPAATTPSTSTSSTPNGVAKNGVGSSGSGSV